MSLVELFFRSAVASSVSDGVNWCVAVMMTIRFRLRSRRRSIDIETFFKRTFQLDDPIFKLLIFTADLVELAGIPVAIVVAVTAQIVPRDYRNKETCDQ